MPPTPTVSRRRWPWIAAAGATVAVAAVIAVLAWPHHIPNAPSAGSATAAKPGPSSSPSARTAAPALTQQQADTISTALASQNPAVTAPVLSGPVRATFLAAPSPLLPTGSTVSLDLSHQQIIDAVDRVPMTVAGGSVAGRYVLILTWEVDHWAVLGTQPA